MDSLKFVAIFSLLTSCTETGTIVQHTNSDSLNNITVHANPISPIQVDSSKLTAKQLAEDIISGQIHATDSGQTFAWLDSLQSDSKLTREVAFDVYRAVCLKADGALSEAICGHIKSYFEVYPGEFLENYTMLDEKQKLQTTENIAVEFYASGTDYKKDIDEYIMAITRKCETCRNAGLQDIRSTIERKVKQMNE